jgi:hypothetical protein
MIPPGFATTAARGIVVMNRTRLLSAAVFLGLVAVTPAPALADGDCTPRPPTAAETQVYAAAYQLFQRVAPGAPDGWAAHDSPPTGAMPVLCGGSASAPLPRGFQRNYARDSDQQARDAEAVHSYADIARQQQATAAANQAKIDAVDAKIKVLNDKVQQAATAQRFAEIDPLNQQIEALVNERVKLAGYDQLDQQAQQIEADHSRDTEASFHLWFEAPRNEERSGQPYRTSAGQGYATTYDDTGNPHQDVLILFAGSPQQACVRVSGSPQRVRALVDGADLKTIAAFR